MNSPTDTQNTVPTGPSAQHQLGYWLRTVDVSIRSAMHNAFAQQGIGRRSWRTLSAIADGASSIDEITAAMPPRRRPQDAPDGEGRPDARHPGGHHFGGRPFDGRHFGERPTDARAADERSSGERHPGGHHFGERPTDGHGPRGHFGPEGKRRRSTQDVVDELAARGWITPADGDSDGIAITDAGRAAHAELLAQVRAVRSTVTDAVSPEDLATTLASLEAIARGFGWDESTMNERGPRGRRGFGPRGRESRRRPDARPEAR
ncbi:MarR family winged helix-turn-helix transcriptional regulator [Plantibacter sp. Mn2098]|uniref:MarR family winged helix-turn-helix transcriptional regulator n=1 Tax=Plantibacter sp. Mn2098 TaxID=3395266 RepID=UPI003BBE7E1C